jgi:TPR repeat protein
MAGLVRRVKGWVASPAGKLRDARKLIAKGRMADAFPLLGQAAQAGLAEAEFLVARCYLEGAGVPPSAIEGARWLERSANQGNAEAQSMLAALYVRGIPGAEAAAGPGGEAQALAAGRPAASRSRIASGPDVRM